MKAILSIPKVTKAKHPYVYLRYNGKQYRYSLGYNKIEKEIEKWQSNRTKRLSKGILLSEPVGYSKTSLIEFNEIPQPNTNFS